MKTPIRFVSWILAISIFIIGRSFAQSPITEDPPLVNVSTRLDLDPGATVTFGIVVGGKSRKVLIRGVGPGLRDFGVTNAVTNPRINLYRRSTLIFGNAVWHMQSVIPGSGIVGTPAEIVSTAARVGAFPLKDGSFDSAMLVTLAPGDYSIIVVNESPVKGNVLAEVYYVP